MDAYLLQRWSQWRRSAFAFENEAVLVNVINNAIDACSLFQEKYHSSGYQGKIALHCDYQANQ
ncbi:hypothetical protein HPQ59_00060, partial [Vibrio parahaemolyticus]|uniref:hypothetical protein n=1 Tax=Vibrio parahaemolyticus TaxID=670 RepID=UPI001C91FA38